MSAIATGGAIMLQCKIKVRKAQDEGISLLLVDRTESNGHCQD